MASHGTGDNYVAIWRWLILFLIVGVCASLLPGGRAVAVVVIFGAAAVKAVLVLRNYMHLRSESWLIYSIVIIPILFVAGLILALFPDFVFHR